MRKPTRKEIALFKRKREIELLFAQSGIFIDLVWFEHNGMYMSTEEVMPDEFEVN